MPAPQREHSLCCCACSSSVATQCLATSPIPSWNRAASVAESRSFSVQGCSTNDILETFRLNILRESAAVPDLRR